MQRFITIRPELILKLLNTYIKIDNSITTGATVLLKDITFNYHIVV